MPDTDEATGSAEDGGLARAISVAGLSVSAAVDELQQAAERLIAAEERARDADSRVTAVDEQLAQAARKGAELIALVEEAKAAQIEADERARSADERAREAVGRAERLEEESRGHDARVEELEARIRELEEQVRGLEEGLSEADDHSTVTVIVDDERTALQEAVSAEVRRPLTSILGITLALKHTDSSSPDGREMIRQLATNARKLDRLVGEMLDIDRISSGTFTPNLRRTDLEALVRRVVEESPDLANRDVKVSTAHVALQVDPGLTEQMVESLLANAGRRTVPGNQVWVSVSAGEGGAIIAVDDAGPEVPPGLRQAMFATLQAGDGRPRGATGFALLSKLAEIHGGRCWVEEGPGGGGASFRVYLPDAMLRRETAEPEAEVGVEQEHPALVAEDEDVDLEEGSVAS